MRRMYDVAQFRKTVNKFRSTYPGFNFTTDIIVGFPGETDEEFEQTLDAIKEFDFSHIHTFKYSVRKGTRAERLENHLPEKIKTERSLKVRDLSVENMKRYFETFIGQTQNVLIERISEGTASGYGENYIPVHFKLPGAQKNMIIKVKLTGLVGEDEDMFFLGEIVGE